jgi:hypothetical protein
MIEAVFFILCCYIIPILLLCKMNSEDPKK